MTTTSEILEAAADYFGKPWNQHRKAADVLGRVVRVPGCAVDYKATDEEFAAEAARLGVDFSTLAGMGV